MSKEPLILLSGIGLIGYITFHGHRQGKDCFLCPWRGVAFAASSVGLGVYLAFSEENNG